MIPENRQFSYTFHTPANSMNRLRHSAWVVLTWCVGSGEPLVSGRFSPTLSILNQILIKIKLNLSWDWGNKIDIWYLILEKVSHLVLLGLI